jgi:hypothetical protein
MPCLRHSGIGLLVVSLVSKGAQAQGTVNGVSGAYCDVTSSQAWGSERSSPWRQLPGGPQAAVQSCETAASSADVAIPVPELLQGLEMLLSKEEGHSRWCGVADIV